MYDPPAARGLLFGGIDAGTIERSDTWLWNGRAEDRPAHVAMLDANALPAAGLEAIDVRWTGSAETGPSESGWLKSGSSKTGSSGS